MFNNKKLLVISMGALLALQGCGGESENAVPAGSTVKVTPEEISWEIPNNTENGLCAYDPNNYVDQTISISVLNGAGQPLGDIELTIALNLSSATYSGTAPVQLYDDQNGNGVPDHPQELVSDENSGVFRTSTGKYSGTKFVMVRTNLSCPYKTSLYAFAGTTAGKTDIVVVEKEKTDTEATGQ